MPSAFFERAGLVFVARDSSAYEHQRVRELRVTLGPEQLSLTLRERVEEIDPGSGERSVTEHEARWVGRFLGTDDAGNGLVLLLAPAPSLDRLRLAPSGGQFVQYAEHSEAQASEALLTARRDRA